MVKKAKKDEEIPQDVRSRGGSPGLPSKTSEVSSAGKEDQSSISAAAEALSASVLAKVNSSPINGIGSLIESLVGYLGESESEQSEMKEFLEMLVDTDPVLKNQLLESLGSTRKP